MPIAITQDLPEGTQLQYDAVIRELDLAADPPRGGLAHVAGPRPDGGWRVVAVWESREASEAFLRERLLPARQRAGLTGAPQVEEWPVYKLIR